MSKILALWLGQFFTSVRSLETAAYVKTAKAFVREEDGATVSFCRPLRRPSIPLDFS